MGLKLSPYEAEAGMEMTLFERRGISGAVDVLVEDVAAAGLNEIESLSMAEGEMVLRLMLECERKELVFEEEPLICTFAKMENSCADEDRFEGGECSGSLLLVGGRGMKGKVPGSDIIEADPCGL